MKTIDIKVNVDFEPATLKDLWTIKENTYNNIKDMDSMNLLKYFNRSVETLKTKHNFTITENEDGTFSLR